MAQLTGLKDEPVAARATPPMCLSADLKTLDLKTIGGKFDVILIDPPLEEYARRFRGFRRSEDVAWIKTNKTWPGMRIVESRGMLQHTKEHCLMGIRGTVRRSTDGHLTHCNIDTDVIVAEEPPNGRQKSSIGLADGWM
ncbi:hypothetical protein SeLEV6574_g00725 [Synchytrium endobioticum]|uniref:Uncharacterized protein n=1 Tax=Synchytrium endobioticum TaxID=286115 RepID=A0A507DH85_9FUNG|nr:hypothetical protein SeLEV6574_g00725 [Synchytrium endobioticum]